MLGLQQRRDVRGLLDRTRYQVSCTCRGWYCEHDGFSWQSLRGLGLSETQPIFKVAETIAGSPYYWCSREEFIEALKAVHGEADILSLLLEMEST